MKCYFCEGDARGTCTQCSRGICKEHGVLLHVSRIGSVTALKLVCKECGRA